MHHSKKKRARRRESTLRVALRRRRICIKARHAWCRRGGAEASAQCTCETAPYYFAKRSPSCGCSKKRKGNPKFGRGFCQENEGARETAIYRVRSRMLMHAIAEGWLDMDDIPSPRGFWGM